MAVVRFRVGRNRRGGFRPRGFWIGVLVLLAALILFNLVSLVAASPFHALMLLLLTPVALFLWSRLWYVIELRAGSPADREASPAGEE
jgi:hypothetical protein